jgi:hypothetical protein
VSPDGLIIYAKDSRGEINQLMETINKILLESDSLSPLVFSTISFSE